MTEDSITNILFKFIDEWWGLLVPITLMTVFKQYITNVFIWCILRFSFSPYTSVGNHVFLEGNWWVIYTISLSNVYLERKIENNETLILKVGIYDYFKSKIIYKKV